jgi:hypothetical protein
MIDAAGSVGILIRATNVTSDPAGSAGTSAPERICPESGSSRQKATTVARTSTPDMTMQMTSNPR